MALPVIDADRTRAGLPFSTLIPALRDAFAGRASVPTRHHHHIPQRDGSQAVLLLMPAWQDGGYLGIKIASIFSGNAAIGLPSVHSTYLLCDATTGAPLAVLDGDEITGRRTVGVAALAASCLARPDAASLVIVGSGRIAGIAAAAFAQVRSIRRVTIWDRKPAKAEALARQLCDQGFDALATPDLEAAVRQADIVSCATLSTTPLIKGEWLAPGTHLDLIGSFTPAMREAADACMSRGRIYVDTMDALLESGDLIQPVRAGIIGEGAVTGTLAGLCSGSVAGRTTGDDITVFKAVGTALADLAAAALCYHALGDTAPPFKAGQNTGTAPAKA